MELEDYGGTFNPDLQMTDFSKDALIRLVYVAARDYIGMDGIWHSLVRENYGIDKANDFTRAVWTRPDSPGMVQDIRRLVEAFNIKGNDVATLFKYFQLSPVLGIYFYKQEFELISPNHGILSIVDCPSIKYFERHREMEMAKVVCADVDVKWIQEVAHYFNPKMQVKSLSDLPRKSPDEVPCRWEFKVVE